MDKKTRFRDVVKSKGYTFSELQELWGYSPRQMTRIAASNKLRHLHMALGLPDKAKLTNDQLTRLRDMMLKIEQQLESVNDTLALELTARSNGDVFKSAPGANPAIDDIVARFLNGEISADELEKFISVSKK